MAFEWIQAFRDFAQLAAAIKVCDAKLNALLVEVDALRAFVAGERSPTMLRLDAERSLLLDKQGRVIMSGTVNITTDHDARVPLQWKDDVGTVSAPDAANTVATSDNTAVATVDVAADDASVVVRSVADGTCNVTVTNGSLTDTIVVNVTDPSATSLNVDAADAVLVAKGTPA